MALAAVVGAAEGAAYLKGAEGVRSSALGGAFTAVQGSAEGLWYNPAGVSAMRGAQASFSRVSLQGGYDADHIVGGAYLGCGHGLGLLYSRKGATDQRRDASANVIGTFEVSNSVLGAAYSYEFQDYALGLGAKMLSETIDNLSASSTVFDFGLQGDLSHDRVQWGLSLLNYGPAPMIGNSGVDYKAPAMGRAGAVLNTGEPAQALAFLGDWRYQLDSAVMGFGIGAEYSEVFDQNSLALRLGYDYSLSALGGWSGISAGASFGYSWLEVDYAYIPLDVIGGAHKVALTLTYDQKAEAQEKSMDDFLGIDPKARRLPTPTAMPTPTPMRARTDKNVGADLDALLAPSATPTPTATPFVVEKPREAAKGIFGALGSLFGFGKKKDTAGEGEPEVKKERAGGILKRFFNIFGVEDEDKPVETPEDPQIQSGEDSDSVIPNATPQPGATPQPTPEPTAGPTPAGVKGRLKGLLGL